ncbi:MAG: hypothetical protein GWP07_01340 [Xanthomonadaceae bacterium]|nr:hypothetical protein [Xanthomonadaceae bacterium]
MIRSFIFVLCLLTVIVAGSFSAPAARAADEDTSMTACADCHDEVAAAFTQGPHGKAMAAVSPEMLNRSCAGCHYPSPEHLEDPSPENVHRIPAKNACNSCHSDMVGGSELATPAHLRNNIGCLDCHVSGHQDNQLEHMLRSSPEKLCSSCHNFVAAAFRMPYTHKGRNNHPAACDTCHTIHGTGESGRYSLTSNGGVCIKCHPGKAGPHIYSHPSRNIDGCQSCHDPHGSMNPFQLRRRRVMDLCLECHAGIAAFHNLTQVRYRSCLNCHQAIHGSNRDPLLREN